MGGGGGASVEVEVRLAACDWVTRSDTAAGGGGHRGSCKWETQKNGALKLSGCLVTRAQWGQKRRADKAQE